MGFFGRSEDKFSHGTAERVKLFTLKPRLVTCLLLYLVIFVLILKRNFYLSGVLLTAYHTKMNNSTIGLLMSLSFLKLLAASIEIVKAIRLLFKELNFRRLACLHS